jgi:hypothetical protein
MKNTKIMFIMILFTTVLMIIAAFLQMEIN